MKPRRNAWAILLISAHIVSQTCESCEIFPESSRVKDITLCVIIFSFIPLVDDDLDEEEATKVTEKKNLENDIEDETLEVDEIVNIKESKNHPLDNEELNQFIANDVWELVPHPKCKTIIGTKRMYRNKLDENGIVSRNKARLLAQSYNQQEGIDYDETNASIARL
ncbi:retrovirus-related pol polyprotein from transposon TNT 1-94 [Tanacetum coccineum]